MRTAIPAHCTQSVMDTRMVANPASRAKTMKVSVVRVCSTRLFVLGSRRRSFAVHPKFEVSSKNAQSCPALIKVSQLAWFVRVSGTYDPNRILPILFEFRQTIFIEFVFEKVRSIRFPSNGLLRSTPSSKDEALPNAVVPRNPRGPHRLSGRTMSLGSWRRSPLPVTCQSVVTNLQNLQRPIDGTSS
jgi:hypothetical protein